jgi:transcriptional regulator with XRE-family HTH domain
VAYSVPAELGEREEGSPMTFKATIEYGLVPIALRKCREGLGLTREAVAKLTGFSEAKIKRGESGENEISLEDLNTYMDVYKVPADERTRLRYLRNQLDVGWWEDNRWISTTYARVIQAEDASVSICTTQPSYVPGLFQVESYVRHLCTVFGIIKRAEVEATVEIRARRQFVLTKEKAPTLTAILAPSVFSIGTPEVRKSQLRAILEKMELPNVEVWMLPDGKGIPLDDGTLLVLPEKMEKYVTNVGGFSVVLDDRVLLEAARDRMAQYMKCAMDPDETKTVIEGILKGLK